MIGVFCASRLLLLLGMLLFWFAVLMIGLAVYISSGDGVVWVFGMAIVIRCCCSLR